MKRSEMEQIIVQGGSVLYQGRTISRVQDLPSEADLAVGDPAQEAAATAALQAQMADLQAQIDRLSQPAKTKEPKDPRAKGGEGDSAPGDPAKKDA